MFRLALASSPPKVLRVPKIPHLQEDPPRQGFLEDGQQQLLFEYCSELWFRTAVEIGRTYGWRVSEVKACASGRWTLGRAPSRSTLGQPKTARAVS
jgi:hypothetical protein